MRHIVFYLAISLSAVLALTLASFTGRERDVEPSHEANGAAASRLEEKRRRRDAFVRFDKELADAVATGRLSLDKAAESLTGYCTSEYPRQLKSLETEFGENLPPRQLAFLSLLRTIRYHRATYQHLPAEVGRLMDAMPQGTWNDRSAANPWLAFAKGAQS
jgi:hypothetical protein